MSGADNQRPDGGSDGQPAMELLNSSVRPSPTTSRQRSWLRRLVQIGLPVVFLLVAFALVAVIAAPDLARHVTGIPQSTSLLTQRSRLSEVKAPADLNPTGSPNPSPSPYSQSELKAMIKDLGGNWSIASERVSFTGPQLTDAQLECVNWIPRLSKLSLSGTQISDRGLEHITGLSNLEELKLTNTQITDAGLAHLKGLPRLRYLRVTGTQVTDAAFDSFNQLPSLNALDISETQITEAGLKRLPEIKQLKLLYISKGQFSATEIDGLTTALPDCRVIIN